MVDYGEIIPLIIFIAIILIAAYPKIKKIYTKKKADRLFLAPPEKPVIQTAPKIDWPSMPIAPVKIKNPSNSMKETLEKLDLDLEKNKQNVERVLKEVIEVQKDIYKKMQDYYDMSRDLESKETILRANLEALNTARPSLKPTCPACGAGLVQAEETGRLICPKCGEFNEK